MKRVNQDYKMERFYYFPGPFVAFSAYVDTTTALADKTVFNKVLVNKGPLDTPPYDVTTGVFTCPVSGFYMISIVVGNKTFFSD